MSLFSSWRSARVSVLAFLLFPSLVFAKEGFDLFSQDRGATNPPPREAVAPPPPRPVAKNKKRIPAKPFKLRGTSRIGSRYVAVLEAPNGRDVVVRWRPGDRSPVQGFEGYFVDKIAKREVLLAYPENTECDDLPAAGIRCSNDKRQARIGLSVRAALPPKPQATAARTNVKPAAGDKPTNPFQAALERARGQASNEAESEPPEVSAQRDQMKKQREERLKNFKPKKIDPEDVPAGMKVVHTPFGDRLVPVK